jgi:hypothetical protein
MKTGHSKSAAMKLNVKTTPYFAAYPLKALNLTSQPSANNNNKNNGSATKMSRRLRVLPMINPYSEKKISINKIKLPANIHPIDDNWFNNYE